MNITTMEAATVKFDAQHWLNSYSRGWEEPLMEQANATIQEIGMDEMVPDELRLAASSVWQAVTDTHMVNLMPFGREPWEFNKAYDKSSDDWRVRFIREEKGLGEMPETLGVVFVRPGYEEGEITGWSSRRGTIHAPGTSYTEVYTWVRPGARSNGVASTVLDQLARRGHELRTPFAIDLSDRAASRLIARFAVREMATA